MHHEKILARTRDIFYNSTMLWEEKVAQILAENKKTLSIAESCSGGLLANRITNIPGASHFFKLGLVTYSNASKMKLLKIPPQTLQQYGAVSEQVAGLMAREVRRIQGTDFGIGITGIAGPTGGTKQKPAGLTYIAISTRFENLCLKCHFKGTRLQIKNQAATQALKLLLEFLN